MNAECMSFSSSASSSASQHVIFVVGVVGCNHFISFSSFVYVMSCYCRLIRRRRVVGISMLLSLPTRHLMDAIVVGHRKRHQIASCTEFTQKIHHADDDDDALHQAAQHHHHRPIAGRAPRRPCSADRSGCCGRTASSKCRRRDSIYCCPGVNGSFFRVPSLSRRCIYRHGILRAVNACCWRTRQ